jgi:hypothetical protein
MTQLNQPPNPVGPAEARWPKDRRLQPNMDHRTTDHNSFEQDGPGQGTSGPDRTDHEVDEALGLLSKLPDLEVAEHGIVYAELHDALLEALNAEALNADSPSPSDARRP